jgi:hypothetical protein
VPISSSAGEFFEIDLLIKADYTRLMAARSSWVRETDNIAAAKIWTSAKTGHHE